MVKLFLTLIATFVVVYPSLAQAVTTSISKDIQLIHLQDSIFVHVTWIDSEQYGRFSCNGMLIVSNGEAVMIDTPMTNEQTRQITEYLSYKMNVKVKTFIAGHFHADCIGGLDYLQKEGVESIACRLTLDKCKAEGLPVPAIAFDTTYDFSFHGLPIQCRFYGAGHSFDNITVYLPEQQILFGGCMVKSARSRGLGNLSDAVVDEWDITLEKVRNAYPEIQTVVTGHGNIGGSELLNHTIELVRNKQNKK